MPPPRPIFRVLMSQKAQPGEITVITHSNEHLLQPFSQRIYLVTHASVFVCTGLSIIPAHFRVLPVDSHKLLTDWACVSHFPLHSLSKTQASSSSCLPHSYRTSAAQNPPCTFSWTTRSLSCSASFSAFRFVNNTAGPADSMAVPRSCRHNDTLSGGKTVSSA